MAILNLTPHSIQVYSEDQFLNLKQKSPTAWVADEVVGEPLAEYPSDGEARISTETTTAHIPGIPGCHVSTRYGQASGIPVTSPDDFLIVSLPMQSMAKQANLAEAMRMIAPYKVVRSSQNGSIVLGCMGFTR